MKGFLAAAWAVCLSLLLLQGGQPASAGPVDWHEVTASEAGRQWWDSGSLRLNRDGNLTPPATST